jgi:glycosyltransferase involved in cell wall biosynthesis
MVVHGPYPVGESRVLREARAARAGGYEVDVLAMRLPGEPSREVVDGCSVHRLPHLTGRRRGVGGAAYEYLGFLALAAGWLLRSSVKPYDVVQIHNPPDFLFAAGLASRLRGTCLVFDVHDFAPELFELHFPRAPQIVHRALRSIEAWAMRNADLVLTVNDRYAERIARLRGTSSGVEVILNSLDEGLLPDGVGSPDGELRIVTHGTLNRHYGVEDLVSAFADVQPDVPEARLEIYGDGDAASSIRDRIDELGLQAVVSFDPGLLPQDTVLRIVSGASIGVITNRGFARNHAALPVKLLEYVAMGIPVVTSDLRAIRDYFGPDELVFFPPGDCAALAAALREVCRDPERASARAVRARARYEAYRWETQAARYLRLLDRLLEEPAPFRAQSVDA